MSAWSHNEYYDSEYGPRYRDKGAFPSVSDQIDRLNLNGDDTTSDSEDDGIKVVEEIESLCMKCGETGITRLLLTKIPYFREIILMSFYCDYCYLRNTEVQSAGQIQERGIIYTLNLDNPEDLQRPAVKSDTAVFRIEDLDVEVPAGLGRLTNVEGLLCEILKDLEYGQKRRKREEPALYAKIDAIVQPLLEMSLGRGLPFTVTLNDPAGNSWIEPSSEDSSKKYVRAEYARTPEQNESLGLSGENFDWGNETQEEAANPEGNKGGELGPMEGVDIEDGVQYAVPCECPGCSKAAVLNIQKVKIPYFKEVFICAVVCTSCGYRTSDVKTGGEIPEKGSRIWLEVKEPGDLQRDILKSETCLVKIPVCQVEVQPGTMGGRFTTVEGLLTHIRNDLHGSIFDMDDTSGSGGDSMPEEKKTAWKEFFTQLGKAINAEITYTILLEDPLANSYVQSLHAPDPDPQIKTEEYERTAEEEEELGLADMKTQQDADGEYVREARKLSDNTEKVNWENPGSIDQKSREATNDGYGKETQNLAETAEKSNVKNLQPADRENPQAANGVDVKEIENVSYAVEVANEERLDTTAPKTRHTDNSGGSKDSQDVIKKTTAEGTKL
ncbi:nucleolar zinc-finger protein [Pseudocyphellaria aurata]|nr:nucleolar zinc-finger protein [Pseudocyphellaria aurata]